jgi:hypothetical protein
MAEAGIEVKGLDDILAQLKAIGPDLHETLRPAAEEVLSLLQADMRDYPPELPGQRYERTFDLQHSWQTEEGTSDTELGRVVSYGPEYNRQVQDEDHQAGIHAGRWQTVQSVARDREAQVQAIVETFLNNLLSSV